MATPANSPLNDGHLDQINAALEAVKLAKTQILLAKQAGIDVSQFEQNITDAEAKLRQIKNTYFPNSIY
jgi:hypothetical protein